MMRKVHGCIFTDIVVVKVVMVVFILSNKGVQ